MKLSTSALAGALLAAPAFSQGADECATATPLTYGVTVPFTTSGMTPSSEAWFCVDQAPDIWFEYTTVGSAGNLIVETCGSSYDTALEVFTGTCGALVLVECNDDACGQHSALDVPLFLPIGTTYYIRVGGFGGSSGSGQIRVFEGDLPDCTIPDLFETNFDCSTAAPLGDGHYTELNVEEADNDYYLVSIPAGATLSVDLDFMAGIADIDLFLWDPAIECDTNVAGTGGAYLARSNTTAPTESITYTNTAATPLDVIVEVDMYTGGACNNYDMDVSGVGTISGQIGTAYCSANANSTGAPSEIAATGSTSVAANDLTLEATGLPLSSFGFFLVASTTGFVANPGGSEGNLCLGPSIGRFVGPGQVMSSGGTGSIALAIDLTTIPTPQGFISILPSQTWSFQLWHRDSGMTGPTSNFTNGTTINFN